MIWSWIILERQYCLAIIGIFSLVFGAHQKLKAWMGLLNGIGWIKNHIYIPTCHQTILSTGCDNSGHLVVVLRVREDPVDGLGVIAFDCSHKHRIFRVKIFVIENFEGTVVHGDTDSGLRVNTDFFDIFLLEFSFIDSLHNLPRIVVEK